MIEDRLAVRRHVDVNWEGEAAELSRLKDLLAYFREKADVTVAVERFAVGNLMFIYTLENTKLVFFDRVCAPECLRILGVNYKRVLSGVSPFEESPKNSVVCTVSVSEDAIINVTKNMTIATARNALGWELAGHFFEPALETSIRASTTHP